MSHSIHLANILSNLNSSAACSLNTNERKQLVIHAGTQANFFQNGFSFSIKLIRKHFLIWLCSSHSNFHRREKLPGVLITTGMNQCSPISCIDTDLLEKNSYFWHLTYKHLVTILLEIELGHIALWNSYLGLICSIIIARACSHIQTIPWIWHSLNVNLCQSIATGEC